ncbi:MAG: hypothetical protein KDK48_05100, partial [Chlamydiia bacterium]|nr:hypothetical protein [Chlamydiia bacterium]
EELVKTWLEALEKAQKEVARFEKMTPAQKLAFKDLFDASEYEGHIVVDRLNVLYPQRIFRTFLTEALAPIGTLEEIDALLPQVARDNEALQSSMETLIESGYKEFTEAMKTKNALGKMKADTFLEEMILEFAETKIPACLKAALDDNAVEGALHAALQGLKPTLQSKDFLPSVIADATKLFASYMGGSFKPVEDQNFFSNTAKTVVDTLFRDTLPISDPKMKEKALKKLQDEVEKQLKAEFARFEDATSRKRFVLELLGAEKIENLSDAEIDALIVERARMLALASLPGWMENFFFKLFFYPIYLIVTWYVGSTAAAAAEKGLKLLENDDCKFFVQSLVTTVLGRVNKKPKGDYKAAFGEALPTILTHFGAPGFAARFIPLDSEKSFSKVLEEILVDQLDAQ